jgi:hypothetical protein
MSVPKKSVVKKAPAPAAIRQILSLFGPPPLLSTERREHFEGILAQLVVAIAPANTIEQMWVYDVAVLVWEMMRLRRYKTMFIERKLGVAASHIAREFLGDDEEADDDETEDSQLDNNEPDDIRYIRDGQPRRRLTDALAERNLTTDVIDAEAFRSASYLIKDIEPMLASLQARRDSIIREIGTYRESLARKVKAAIDDVIDIPANQVELSPRLAARNKSTA